MASESPLLSVLREEIRASGPISFYHFMELCLYHPQYGYYNTERVKLGKAGDFYTSAHLAPVFARVLACHLERLWKNLGQPARFDLVELGPGDGLLAAELLSWTRDRFPDFHSCLRYTGVEQSARLRRELQERLEGFGDGIRIVEDLPGASSSPGAGEGFEGCVFANEFFDALPVHLLVWRRGRWRERTVTFRGARLSWCEDKPGSPELEREAESRFDTGLSPDDRYEGWTAELSPLAGGWIMKVSRCLAVGELLVIDYGYTLEEWRQGRFPEGSALAYRRHQVIEDLLSKPGEQDLTAHVNFSQLMEAARGSGLRVRSFESQEKFLMEIGREDEFRDVFADCDSEAERLRRAQLLKTLLLPQGMGETFRVLVMDKTG